MKKSTCSLFAAALLLAAAGALKAQTISTIAGNGVSGYSGDGGQATAAELGGNVSNVVVDTSGNIYIADEANDVIRKVNTSGIISTIAGNNAYGLGYSGDGGPATAAELHNPAGVCVDASGNVYIADLNNNVVRKVDTSGVISTLAGNNAYGSGYSGDGGAATAAELFVPVGVTTDNGGNIYIADGGNSVIRKVNTSGTISTFAGNHTSGYFGDGGLATSAELSNKANEVCGLAYGNMGSMYLLIPDGSNNVVRLVNKSTNVISTIAGNNAYGAGYSGDGGPATAAELWNPSGTAIDKIGNVYIADVGNHVVRKVSGLDLGLKPIGLFTNPVTVYPNPVSNTLYVNLYSVKGKVSLQLYDAMGKQWMNINVNGSQIINIPVGGIAAGIYLMKITTDKGTQVVKKIDIVN